MSARRDRTALIDLDGAFERLRQAEAIGRPLGGDDVLARIEASTRRALAPLKRGRTQTSPPDGRQ